jgi:hypothetical protein
VLEHSKGHVMYPGKSVGQGVGWFLPKFINVIFAIQESLLALINTCRARLDYSHCASRSIPQCVQVAAHHSVCKVYIVWQTFGCARQTSCCYISVICLSVLTLI